MRTGGVGLGFVAGSSGEIILNDPAKRPVIFHYGGVGVGLAVGVKKVPKIGRIIDPKDLGGRGAGTVAPESFPNHGMVYVLEGCTTPDLTADDFKGVCIFYDASAAFGIGYAGEAMLMNCNPLAFVALAVGGVAGHMMFQRMLRPHAMLVSWGPNLGPQANAGISGSVGYLA